MNNVDKKEWEEFLEHGFWYHTIQFPDNLKSNGFYDHTPFLHYYKIPKSLEGKDVLDVGCADGFFSFEAEKRGAKSVLSTDINKFDGSIGSAYSLTNEKDFREKYKKVKSQHERFQKLAESMELEHPHPVLMAKHMLDSKIQYKEHSIYELYKLGKTFDLVLCGDLIEHLKNPIEAVEQLAQVTKTMAIITIASLTTDRKARPWLYLLRPSAILKDRVVTYWGDRGGTFFHFSEKAFARLLKASGFSRVEVVSRFEQPNFKSKYDIPHVVYHAYK